MQNQLLLKYGPLKTRKPKGKDSCGVLSGGELKMAEAGSPGLN